jgi:hypothetical protein
MAELFVGRKFSDVYLTPGEPYGSDSLYIKADNGSYLRLEFEGDCCDIAEIVTVMRGSQAEFTLDAALFQETSAETQDGYGSIIDYTLKLCDSLVVFWRDTSNGCYAGHWDMHFTEELPENAFLLPAGTTHEFNPPTRDY